MSALPRYAQVNLGASGLGTRNRSYYGGATGGLVLHASGLTASPYPVQDTFGILSASGTPGVKVGTPQGPVWTDPWGAPSSRSFRPTAAAESKSAPAPCRAMSISAMAFAWWTRGAAR